MLLVGYTIEINFHILLTQCVIEFVMNFRTNLPPDEPHPGMSKLRPHFQTYSSNSKFNIKFLSTFRSFE